MATENSGLAPKLEAKIIAAVETCDIAAFKALLQAGADLKKSQSFFLWWD
jgi:hypothetical protein